MENTCGTGGDVISPIELEDVVAGLRPVGLDGVGDKEWSKQMSIREELNIQAAIEANRGGEENVRQVLVDNKKLAIMVHDLLVSELWRDHVLHRILDRGKPKTSFHIYMVLFNEANICNLLETILFSEAAAEALEDSAVDLTDYCVRNLTLLLADELSGESSSSCPSSENQHDSLTASDLSQCLANWKPGMDLPDLPVEDVLDEVQRQRRETGFQIAIKCLTIVRYLCDHIDVLPLTVSSRMVITHDLPVLLVQLMDLKPWIRRSPSGDEEVYEGSCWMKTKQDSDAHFLPKVEAQVWLAVYGLLSKKVLADKYELHSYRSNVLSKLVHHIHLDLQDRLPFLEGFKKWLLQLSMGARSPSQAKVTANFMIEPVAEIRDGLILRYRDKWDQLAEVQSGTFLSDNASLVAGDVERLFKAFENDAVQSLYARSGLGDGGSGDTGESSPRGTGVVGERRCACCRKPNSKQRCSRCRNERYCSKECQVKHWPEHKVMCAAVDKRQ